MTDLRSAADRARGWLVDEALPLWASKGRDDRSLFFEDLELSDGSPATTPFRRMRVQTRQLFVFAEAMSLDPDPRWREVVETSFDPVVAAGWAADGGPGWIHTISPDSAPLDRRRDTYDHAFALLALAAVHRATGNPAARALADQTLAYMDGALKHPQGGYQEGDYAAPFRRSNPHMHLLEAMLAWLAATGDDRFRTRADGLIDLFETHFFDAQTNTLGEHFEEDWQPAAGAPGQVVEPGHHFEWCWLLLTAARLGCRDTSRQGRELYRFACEHGLDKDGFAVDEIDRQGRHVRASRRTWPQTELLKAHLAMFEVGDPSAGTKAAAIAHRLLDSYLGTTLSGLWIDQFDRHAAPIALVVPASTFYHLTLAFRELFRVAADMS